jgi:alkylated DNA repair protein (DNA oxidative demethylase)
VSDGFRHLPGLLSPARQAALLEAVRGIVDVAPWVVPTMPRSGKPFSVRMSNAGPLGWVSDRNGYRYQPTHPDTGQPWPPIPAEILAVWRETASWAHPPECCLINLYRGDARMGLHQDRDEETFDAPVVSISLGDRALFRIGGRSRRDPTRSLLLESGDVVVLGGASRLAFHGIDRVEAGTSGLVEGGGRINLTLRRVTAP